MYVYCLFIGFYPFNFGSKVLPPKETCRDVSSENLEV